MKKKRKEVVGVISPATQDEDGEGGVSGEQECGFETQGESAISDNFGKYGDQGNLAEQRGTEADEKVLGGAEMGGGNDVLMGDVVEVVADDLLGLNEEQGKEGQVQMENFRGESE